MKITSDEIGLLFTQKNRAFGPIPKVECRIKERGSHEIISGKFARMYVDVMAADSLFPFLEATQLLLPLLTSLFCYKALGSVKETDKYI